MAKNDVQFLAPTAFGVDGSVVHKVVAGTTASINAGEPVLKTLGSAYVTAGADNTPVVGTHYVAGISVSASTETASADGEVSVIPLAPNTIYICDWAAAALPANQAAYDALVGDRVLFDLTGGVFSVLGTDGANNGLVVENLDLSKHPGKCAFSIRNGASYLA